VRLADGLGAAQVGGQAGDRLVEVEVGAAAAEQLEQVIAEGLVVGGSARRGRFCHFSCSFDACGRLVVRTWRASGEAVIAHRFAHWRAGVPWALGVRSRTILSATWPPKPHKPSTRA